MQVKKIFFSFIFFIFISVIFYLGYKFIYKNNSSKVNIIPQFLDSVKIVDTKFLISKDTTIYFTMDDRNNFKLFGYNYRHEKVAQQTINYTNVFEPFFYEDTLVTIHDKNGDEEFFPTLSELNQYTNNKPIKYIESSPSGAYIIFQTKNDPFFYFLNVKKKLKIPIFRIDFRFYSACFSKNEKILLISIFQKLYLYDIKKNHLQEIFKEIEGDKLNPSIYENKIFFVNNSKSEYFQIYAGNLSNIDLKPSIIYNCSYDLRLPKYDGNFLYYLQLIKSEYLLFRKKLNSSQIEQITKKGVVYNYDFWEESKIILIYSDFFTPTSLILFNTKNKLFQNLTGHSINTKFSYSIFKPNHDLASSYLLKSNTPSKNRGIILFIHPGLRSDFSPRWDSILMGLIANNYIIIAPNYPMSIGYGKTYNNSNVDSAVQDLINWRKYIKKKFPSNPLYVVTSSSGNILLEKYLNKDNKNITAAVSLFGLPGLQKITFSVPLLYILGKNNPLVHYQERNFFLLNAKEKVRNIFIESYRNEGHWFRHISNIKNALYEILEFFNKYE